MQMKRHKGLGLGLKAVAVVVFALGAGFLASPQVSAQDEAISIDRVTVTLGGQGSVDLEALNITWPGLGAWMIDIQYDPAVVTPVTCIPAHGGVCNPGFAAGTVRVIGATATGLQGDNKLAGITFRCETAGSSALALSVDELADATPGGPQQVDATLQNGSVTCTVPAAPTLGDVNCDGVVNTVDAALILQFDAGLLTSLTCP